MRSRIGFVGERLRDARILRGFTGTALAERVGVTGGALSQYESNTSEPRAGVFSSLAEALQVPERYLITPLPAGPESPFLFRSQTATAKRAREASTVMLKWMLETTHYISARVELPAANIPQVHAPENPEVLRDDDILSAASEVRRHWVLGTGPVADLNSLLEANGIVLGLFSFNGEGQDSVSKRDDLRSFVAVNADAVTYVRARFDVAHELGHVLLHRNVPPLTAVQPALHRVMERQAHSFAAAFLFPEKSFRAEVYSISLGALMPLKRRWGVSIQMMQRRARDLSLISDSQYQRACIDISRRGYRKSEPSDDSTPVERPVLLRKAIDLLVANSATRMAAVDGLCLPIPDVELICGLGVGFFSAGPASVVPLRSTTRSQDVGVPGLPGQVLPFQKKP